MKSYTKYILWTARIWGTAIFLFISIFLVGHLFDDRAASDSFSSTSELITFICFPVLTFVGFGLALKWEKIGGGIVILGLGTLLFLRSDLADDVFFTFGIGIPALLYLLYGVLTKSSK